MEIIETKNQSNIIRSPRLKKAMGSFITWALLAQTYLGYGAVLRPVGYEKVMAISSRSGAIAWEEEVSGESLGLIEKEEEERKKAHTLVFHDSHLPSSPPPPVYCYHYQYYLSSTLTNFHTVVFLYTPSFFLLHLSPFPFHHTLLPSPDFSYSSLIATTSPLQPL